MALKFKLILATLVVTYYCMLVASDSPHGLVPLETHHHTTGTISVPLHDQLICPEHELNSSTLLCSDLQPPSNISTVEHSLCILDISDSAPEPSFRSLQSRQQPHRPPFTQSEDGKTMSWCYSAIGFQPRQEDVLAVCDSIPSHFQISRARNGHPKVKIGQCLCHQWAINGASYRACNCDRCDSLTKTDWKVNCLYLNSMCPKQGFLSGYTLSMDLEEENFLGILNGRQKMGDYWFEQVDKKALQSEINATCNSGNEHRDGQDYTGPLDVISFEVPE